MFPKGTKKEDVETILIRVSGAVPNKIFQEEQVKNHSIQYTLKSKTYKDQDLRRVRISYDQNDSVLKIKVIVGVGKIDLWYPVEKATLTKIQGE